MGRYGKGGINALGKIGDGYVCSNNNATATSGDDPIDCLEILRGNRWAPSR